MLQLVVLKNIIINPELTKNVPTINFKMNLNLKDFESINTEKRKII